MSFQEEFGYEFVKDILDAVIQPQKPPNSLYSSEIVRRLIQKGVVRSAMVAAGLLVSLRMRNDWVFRISSMFFFSMNSYDLFSRQLILLCDTFPTSLKMN